MRMTNTLGVLAGALAIVLLGFVLLVREPSLPANDPITSDVPSTDHTTESESRELEPPPVASALSTEIANQVRVLADQMASLSQQVRDSLARVERVELEIRRGEGNASVTEKVPVAENVQEVALEESKQQRAQLLDQLLAEPASGGDAVSAEELLRTSSSVPDGSAAAAQLQAVQCGQRLCRMTAELANAGDLQGFVIKLKEKLVAAGDGSWNPPLEVHTDELAGGQLQAKLYIPRAGATLPD